MVFRLFANNVDAIFNNWNSLALSLSLKSLPTAEKEQQSGDVSFQEAKEHQMDLLLVTDAAKWLSMMLNLTIFGFDVVVSSQI